jgi:hypothetical protein
MWVIKERLLETNMKLMGRKTKARTLSVVVALSLALKVKLYRSAKVPQRT